MSDQEPLADIAKDSTLRDLQVDVDDIIVRAILRKLIQLKFDTLSNLQVGVTTLPTLSTLTTLATMTTGNISMGDSGKSATYQQFSAMTGDNSKRCFVWE